MKMLLGPQDFEPGTSQTTRYRIRHLRSQAHSLTASLAEG